MIRTPIIIVCIAVAWPSFAETLTAVRAIRPMTVIEAGDISEIDVSVPGGLTDADQVVGMEARITLYPGRPIRRGDVGPPALVERNQVVELLYNRPGLTISTEGRALDRAAAGEWIRVLNLSSRTSVTGLVLPSGAVSVSPQRP